MARVVRCEDCLALFRRAKLPPYYCPSCALLERESQQTVATVPDEPGPAWELTRNDRQFLKSHQNLA